MSRKDLLMYDKYGNKRVVKAGETIDSDICEGVIDRAEMKAILNADIPVAAPKEAHKSYDSDISAIKLEVKELTKHLFKLEKELADSKKELEEYKENQLKTNTEVDKELKIFREFGLKSGKKSNVVQELYK